MRTLPFAYGQDLQIDFCRKITFFAEMRGEDSSTLRGIAGTLTGSPGLGGPVDAQSAFAAKEESR